MRRRTRLPFLLSCAALLAAGVPSAEAQVTATAVLKSGQRHTGSNLAYRVDGRQVIVRTSQAEEPRIPVDQVAYIDFGGTADPPNLNLSGSQEAVVMRDGSVQKGQILELGHANKADLSSPFLVIFRTESGEERRLPASQVARVVLRGRSTVVRFGVVGRSADSSASSSPGLHRPFAAALDTHGHRAEPRGSVCGQGKWRDLDPWWRWLQVLTWRHGTNRPGQSDADYADWRTDRTDRHRPAIPDRDGFEHRGASRRPAVPGHQRQQRLRQPRLVSGRHSALCDGPTPTVVSQVHGSGFRVHSSGFTLNLEP